MACVAVLRTYTLNQHLNLSGLKQSNSGKCKLWKSFFTKECVFFVFLFLHFSFIEQNNIGMSDTWWMISHSFDERGLFLLALSLSLVHTGWFCYITTSLEADFRTIWHVYSNLTLVMNMCIFIDSGFCKKGVMDVILRIFYLGSSS